MKLIELYEQRSSIELERERLAKKVEKANKERERRYAQLHKDKKRQAKEREAEKRHAARARKQADQAARADHERRMAKFDRQEAPDRRDAAGQLRTN